MPVVTATERTTAVVGGSSGRRLSRALAVGAAEEASKDGSQTGETTSNDADVEFQTCPDGNVSRVPEPVTQLAVVCNVAQLYKRGSAGKDTEAQDADEGDSCAEVNVEFPEHGRGDDDGEEKIGDDVERRVCV